MCIVLSASRLDLLVLIFNAEILLHSDLTHAWKSGYMLLEDIRDLNGKNTASPRIWKMVCGVISGKPRHLQNSATSYEGVSGALAVKERLKFHCINLDATCDVCGHHSETICHVFFCLLAQNIWDSLGSITTSGFLSKLGLPN